MLVMPLQKHQYQKHHSILGLTKATKDGANKNSAQTQPARQLCAQDVKGTPRGRSY